MARANTILGDGTFRITPHLWYQTFILSAEVQAGVFVPVAFSLLPDKTKNSYDEMFKMVKDCLNVRGLQLSPENFMSDFETNIRKSFHKYFKDVTIKGCHFHYAKALWTKVVNNGFKIAYTACSLFGGFVRACIGLAYVPLERMAEGVQNLKIIARTLEA